MPVKEALFWFGLTLFATGATFLLKGKRWLAILGVVVGAISMGYSVYVHYRPEMRISIPIWIYLLILTWLFIAYDIYLQLRITSDSHAASTSGSAHCGPLIIHSATYGTGPLKELDVTEILQKKERTGLVVLVSNDTFGKDPVPGVPKHLEVEYSYETTRRFKTSAVEGNRLVLPEP